MRSRRDFSRQRLVALLIRERNVARFVVAPSGYGKSSLALEYADVVFGFKHVFWLEASSPCFSRDLDDDSLLAQLEECDSRAGLVVFEDVPLLDPTRAARFSSVLDVLLERGIEVVVTCTPAADVYAGLQRDRIKVRACDLLLDDEELAGVRSDPDCPEWLRASSRTAVRIPHLAWGSCEEGAQSFVAHLGEEELSGEIALVHYCVLLLGEGDVETLAKVCPNCIPLLAELQDDYPHLGIDLESGRFDAVPIDIADVVWAFRSKSQPMLAASSAEDRTSFAFGIAGALVIGGNAQRALAVVDKLCPRPKRATWIVDNARELARQTQFADTLEVIGRLRKLRIDNRAALAVIEAFFLVAIDDRAAAVALVKRLAFDSSTSEGLRLAALALVAHGDNEALQMRAELEMGRLVANGDVLVAPSSFWDVLALGMRARAHGTSELVELCNHLLAGSSVQQAGGEPYCDVDALCLVVSWLFDGFSGMGEMRLQAQRDLTLETYMAAEAFVRERLDAAALAVGDYFAFSAALSLERAHMRGLPLVQGVFDTTTLMALRTFEMAIIRQRALFVQQREAKTVKDATRIQAHPDLYWATGNSASAPARLRSVPQLTVHLFGRMDVWVGNHQISHDMFHRTATRQLLVMLAINVGRELSRQTIEATLWPDSSPERASRNFYSIWSQLRRILTLPDGTCPYLTRHALGCSLEPRYVQSDAKRLSDICRDMLFGEVNVGVWSEMFREIDRDFSDELAPSEKDNVLIAQARTEYRARLVDALVGATRRVVDEHEPQCGVWFARRALIFDETREDAYLALMAAQAASGQRTAAMETFMQMRRVLAEKLGIDPSPEAQALYETLLDVDDAA